MASRVDESRSPTACWEPSCHVCGPASLTARYRTRAAGAARIEATCSYRKPLRYEDVVELHLLVKEKRTRSIAYQVVFRTAGVEVARGSMVVVFVAKTGPEGGMVSVPIPPAAAEVIEAAPANLLI